jgi:type I restriction enzyme S subunit
MGAEAEVIGGGTPKTNRADYFGGDIPWITPADLSGYKQKYVSAGARNITKAGLDHSGAKLMPAGTVLFSSRAPIGYVAIAANPVSTNQGFKSFVLKNGLTADFVYYYLQHAKKLALELASGTTFQEISGKNAARIPIPVPPLSTQNAIVAEIEKQFTRLDAGVAALRRLQANLKRYRAAVLKAACEGRLVPTEAELAKAEGRTHETGEQLLARILADRRKNWHGRGKYKEPAAPDTTNLPPLPEGWAWATIDQLSTRVVDGTHHTPTYVSEGIAFISVKDVRDGKVHFEDCKYISLAAHEELSKRCNVELGDVLITKSGTIGRIAVVQTNQPFSLFVSVALIKPVRGFFDSKFLALLLEGYIGSISIAQVVKGGLLKNLHLEDLRVVTVGLPPLAEQIRIVAEVERRLSVIEELEAAVAANVQRAARLRQCILRRAFSAA